MTDKPARLRAASRRLGLGGLCVGCGILLGLFAAPVIHTFQQQRAYREYLVDLKSREGKAAPTVQGTLLDGSPWTLSQERGKIVVLDFWATWCAPCIEDFPTLERVAQEYASAAEFALVGVNFDLEHSVAESFVDARGVAWPQVYENWTSGESGLRAAFGLTALPSIWVIDRDGTVLAAQITVEELPAILRRELAESA